MRRLVVAALAWGGALIAACADAAHLPTAPSGAAAVRRNVAPVNVSAAIQSGPGATCLDVPSGNFTPGTRPQLWDCLGNGNQTFTWGPDGRISPTAGQGFRWTTARATWSPRGSTPASASAR